MSTPTTPPKPATPRRIRVYAVAKPGEGFVAAATSESAAWARARIALQADKPSIEAVGYRLIPGWLELEEGV